MAPKQQKRIIKNKSIRFMFIDIILSLCSSILSYKLIGTVGTEVDTKLLAMAIVYLPISVLMSMIIIKGYRSSLKQLNINDFIGYSKGMLLAAAMYIIIDLAMGYTSMIVLKLFAVIATFLFMMLARLIYFGLFKKFGGVTRVEQKKTVSSDKVASIDFDALIEDRNHKKVRLNVDATRYFQGKTVLITGAGGTIGSNLYKKMVKFGAHTVIGVDIYENTLCELENSFLVEESETKRCYEIASIRDYKKMNEVYAKYRPDVVYHAAAHKHVLFMEKNPEEAVKNNVFGTFTCAKLADIYNVDKFIYISTDKAHNPCGIMGATKRIGEMIMNYMAAKSKDTKYITLRFCNIIASNASVIPLMCKQIEAGGPIQVTDKKASRYFISSAEAINYIINMTISMLTSDIYILNVEKPTNIKELATKLVKAYGLKVGTDIEMKFTSLHQGERLSEELIPSDAELFGENVYMLKHEKQSGRTFYRKLNQLNIATKENDVEDIRKAILELVPDFDYKFGNNGNTKNEYEMIATIDEFVG